MATPRWRDWPGLIAGTLDVAPGSVLIGHSAAGLLLPALAAATGASALVFVDARIPERGGQAAPADPAFMKFIRARADAAGRLPPWSRWWGADGLAALLPDAAARAALDDDAPRLTCDWFEDAVGVPSWSHLPAAYVRLSKGYENEAADADARGWPVFRVAGNHLFAIADPHATADAIAAAISKVKPAPSADGAGL
jgi:hypothetical protein